MERLDKDLGAGLLLFGASLLPWGSRVLVSVLCGEATHAEY